MNIENVKLLHIDTIVNTCKETKIVAIYDNNIIGSIGLDHINKRSSCLLRLFVHQDFRKCGIGSKLVNECCKISKESGCETVGLLLAKNNDAESFYNKLDFSFSYQYDDGDILMVRYLRDLGSTRT